ncbi:hypothetical protein HPB52_022330 [Rhipicephalus sanguineus]|uniref:Uncharacterized protein n=1 Tax=Rhipicephalus sanguineus TaxID=34632 RepID=A0A9D4Q3H8_RHISA|nr:hypothetical protein HPB52_022330 [Rhipicephalus sanguineus]
MRAFPAAPPHVHNDAQKEVFATAPSGFRVRRQAALLTRPGLPSTFQREAAVGISDSQAAARGFTCGHISWQAARIVPASYGGRDGGDFRGTMASTSSSRHFKTENATFFLLWTPADTSVPLADNQASHTATRDLTP